MLLWPYVPCIQLGTCPVDRQRLWNLGWVCRSSARGSMPWWRASPWSWLCTTSGADWSLSWWSDFFNQCRPPPALQRILRWRLQQRLRPPRNPPPLGRCTLSIWPCGTIRTGLAHAPWFCPWFFGWGAQYFWCAISRGLVSGGKTHFGLGENEREETVLAPPFSGCEMARKVRKLFDEVSNGVEGGLPHNCVERDCFHTPP